MNFKTLAKNWMMIGGAVAGLAILSHSSSSAASINIANAEVNLSLDHCEKKALLHLQESLAQVAQISGTNEIGDLTVLAMHEKTTSRNLTIYEVKVLRTNLNGEPVGCLAKLRESGLDMTRPNIVEICSVTYKAWAAKDAVGECSLDNIKSAEMAGIRGLSFR